VIAESPEAHAAIVPFSVAKIISLFSPVDGIIKLFDVVL